MTIEHTTAREEWLNKAMNLIIKQVFEPNALRTPVILRVACGLLPSKWWGACANPEMAEDGACHIWISPELGTGQEMDILATLTHELVHSHCFAEGFLDHKHGHPFNSIIRTVGLAGKPSSTTVDEGTELWSTLEGIAVGLGPYPHMPLRKKPKKTRQSEMITYVSETDEEYTVKLKFSQVYEKGAPRDFNDQPMKPKDQDKWNELEAWYLSDKSEEEAEKAEEKAAE